MPLRLTITSYHKLTPGQSVEAELDRGELRIGRAPDNDWVLPDLERLVSSHHCTIQSRDGTYYLTDTSTNGALQADAGVRLQRGNSEPLRDGEHLRLGDHELLVRIDAVAGSLPREGGGLDAWLARPAAFAAMGTAPLPASPLASAPAPAGPSLFDLLAEPGGPPLRADRVPVEREDFRPPEPRETPPEAAAPIPADWDPFAEPPAVAPPLASGKPGDALEAFLRGAGLAQLRLERSAAAVQMEAIGRSYRLMVEGLLEVLRARASLKGEFRLAQTMIRPIRNNPLKFSPNADEALLLLLRPGNPAFMPPDQAVAESFGDLKAHRLAVMAGVQAALRQLLGRFDPQVLKTRLGELWDWPDCCPADARRSTGRCSRNSTGAFPKRPRTPSRRCSARSSRVPARNTD
ncbi:FHA domain protein [Azotobacter beijerinckii]|uniref:FHA domain protein n=1 Tax=Azotobacter beijerinckii TaxID=170623 RepID=A0A1I4CTR7_9GAMM|nr:FHA domain protein [Azotobacter beijerinckii]SFK83719.1 FHA domain protein [Azotobacter beijerinckii]